MRIGLCSPHPDLFPFQEPAVGKVPAAVDGIAAQSTLQARQIIHGDRPAQPAAAGFGAGPDNLPERCFVGDRVFENLDDLDVAIVGQRDQPVAGAEPGMEPTVTRGLTQRGG